MDIKQYQAYFAKGFSQFVRNACAKQDMSAAELGRLTGLSRSYCGKIIKVSDDPPQPTLASVHAISKALGFEGAKILYALEMNLKKTSEKPRVRAVVKHDDAATKVLPADTGLSADDLISTARV